MDVPQNVMVVCFENLARPYDRAVPVSGHQITNLDAIHGVIYRRNVYFRWYLDEDAFLYFLEKREKSVLLKSNAS